MNLPEVCNWIDSRAGSLGERLVNLSGINSGTGNPRGLAQVAAAFADWFRPLADTVETLPSDTAQFVNLEGDTISQSYGDMVSCVKRPDAPFQVLLTGHMDTVFPADHPFQSPRRLDAKRLTGPGVADMKGGLLVMLTALEAFERAGPGEQLGWRVILNADEETGSHGSLRVLESAARQAHAGLIYEPALADGTLAGARKGSGNFTLVAHGVSAHAGREFERGRNAIMAMTKIATELAQLTNLEQGITVNVARISGGSALNVVPDKAICQFNVRCRHASQQQAFQHQLQGIVERANNDADGIRVELSGSFTRPPKTISAASQLLMDWTAECGETLHVPVRFVDTGGCCDGNNLAAAGLPNVDTLGVLGGAIHTDREFMLLDSLCERARLSLLLLQRLATDGERLLALRQAGA